MIETDEKRKESRSPLLPQRFHSLSTTVDLLMTIAIKIITVYIAVTSLSSPQKFSISRLICFRAVYLFNKERGRKLRLFFIKLLIAPQAKAAS